MKKHEDGFDRFATYAALFAALYIYWPKDISNTPLASLTLNDILGTAFAIAVGFFLIKNLFEPSEEDETKEAWGWLGVLMVFLAISALVYFQYH
jgi:hypothetical protein